MAVKQMKRLVTLGKYKLYWADKSFMYQGLWLWGGTTNRRIVPLNRFNNWTGKNKEVVS